MSFSSFWMSQAVRLPLLLAYLTGVILAIMWYSQAPKAMFRIALGCALLLAAGSASMSLVYFINVQNNMQVRQNLMLLSSVIPLIQLAGFCILLTGAFSSRRTEEQGFPIEMRVK